MKQNLLFNQASALGTRLAMVLTMLLIVGIGQAWGADVVYKTAKFGSSYNSTKVSSYTSSWYSTYDGFRVDIVNANNNNNGWSYIKMGSKNAASTGTITTNAKIDAAITKVSLKIDAITSSNVTSITLKTATSSNGTYTSVGTFSKATGTQTVTLTSPTANLFYKIEVVCTKGSSNGLIQISQVDYYKADAVSCTTAPIVSAASNSNITSTTATVSCSGITSLGSAGCSITSYGFVYGTTANPTISSNTKVQVGTTYTTTSTAFSKELTVLTANTTYYVRPYATNGYGTAYGTQTSFKTLELPKYTVTLKDDNSTLTQSTAGGSVTLPPRDGCDGYTFAGWTSTWTFEQTTWTTIAPTIINAGSYTPTADVNLYPVYTKTETTQGTTTTTDYVLTDLANIKSTDVVVITSKNSSNAYYAMSNNNGTGSAPAATSVSVSSSKLSSAPDDKFKWNISNNSGTLTIYPNGTTAKWLYCTNTNNGVRVGDNTNKTFKIDATSGYLNHSGTSRYIGVYNKSDWRCYTTVHDNIKDQTLAFFVETTTTISTSTTTTSYISVPDCTKETVLSVVPENLDFGDVSVGQQKQMTFKLTGQNITNATTLSISGDSQGFSVSPFGINDTGNFEKEITVTYAPTTAGDHSQTIVISSEDADDVTVSLSGTGVAQTANYTVNHYQQNITDDNYTLKETENLSGEVGTKVTPAFKSYEGFTAPTEEKSVEITADGKAIVEYQYARNSYTLTWNLDGGTITTAGTPEGEVKYGASLTAPVVKKDGFNFKGWDSEVPNTMPAANATYTAQWKKKHTIKWIVNGATDTPYETTYVVDGDALALPSNPNVPSTCEEKVFMGWTESANVNADGSNIEYVDENTLPNTDKTYYAVFASPDANGAGGEYKKVTSALSDWSGEYLIVYETGKIAFDGGKAEEHLEDGYHISVTIEDNAIAATTEMDNAKFTVAKITGGYSVKSASGYYIGCEANDKGLYPSQDIQYLNQIFWGKPWDSAAEGVIIKSQNDPILLYSTTAGRFRYYSSAQEPISLYRKSSYTDYTTVCVETYNVKYDANGATSGNVPVDENNYIFDATVTVLGNTGNLQMAHYSFVGWNTQADGNGITYQEGETFTITEDIILYAMWEELPLYSVTWYVNGKPLTEAELQGASTTVYDGYRISKTPPAPNPEDFCGEVFVGWTDAEMDVNNTSKPTIYSQVDEFPEANGNQTFYAVFADYVTE